MFSDFFDIYFFDEFALATLASVEIADSVSAPAATATATGAGTPMLGISAPAASAAITGTVTVNVSTVCDVPAALATATGTVDAAISLTVPAATGTTSGTAADMLMVAAPAATATGTGVIGSIFIGPVVSVPAAQATSSGTAAAQVELSAPAAMATGTGVTNVSILFAPTAASAATSGSVDAFSFARAAAMVRYYFTLTGDADGYSDITIPISTLNSRVRQGTPTYISVTVPGLTYINHITNRSNGEMVVYMVYVDTAGGEYGRREIARAELESIRYDRGGNNQSITLMGHKSTTFGSPRTVTISNPTYKSYNNGALRFRAPLDLALYPGDTAVVGSDSFVIDNLTYIIGVGQANMEISEAAA